jgi:hypothetical protein
MNLCGRRSNQVSNPDSPTRSIRGYSARNRNRRLRKCLANARSNSRILRPRATSAATYVKAIEGPKRSATGTSRKSLTLTRKIGLEPQRCFVMSKAISTLGDDWVTRATLESTVQGSRRSPVGGRETACLIGVTILFAARCPTSSYGRSASCA